MARLLAVSINGEQGAGVYWTVVSSPRYLHSLVVTVLLSAAVTLVPRTLILWRGPRGGTASLLAGSSGPDMLELWAWELRPGE